MLSEGWTAEATGCDRLSLQSGHLLRRTFQALLLFQTLNSSWAHQGQTVESRDDLSAVLVPGCLLLFVFPPAAFPTTSLPEPTALFQVRAQPANKLCPERFSLVTTITLCIHTKTSIKKAGNDLCCKPFITGHLSTERVPTFEILFISQKAFICSTKCAVQTSTPHFSNKLNILFSASSGGKSIFDLRQSRCQRKKTGRAFRFLWVGLDKALSFFLTFNTTHSYWIVQ